VQGSGEAAVVSWKSAMERAVEEIVGRREERTWVGIYTPPSNRNWIVLDGFDHRFNT
jgi:hypothetical protein